MIMAARICGVTQINCWNSFRINNTFCTKSQLYLSQFCETSIQNIRLENMSFVFFDRKLYLLVQFEIFGEEMKVYRVISCHYSLVSKLVSSAP